MNTALVESSTNLPMAFPLEVDSLAPYFSGIDQYGEFQSLDRLQSKGPFVIIFYRGHWCDFCTSHISDFQNGLDQLTEEGFPVILVTPEKPIFIQKTLNKTKVKFPVLHDNLNYIMTSYKVAMSASEIPGAPEELLDVNNNEATLLPVPATYIVGSDGVVKYSHFSLNFALRSSFEIVAEKVKEISSTY